MERKKLVGSEEPRIFTPPLRPLTPKTSLGFAAVEFAEDVCGATLYPWQKWLLIHALELHPDGGFRFRTIVVLVARQQGKSMLSVILSLFFMYVLNRELVIGTAQDLDVAEEIWQEAIDLVEETPDLNALKEKVVRVNGKKTLELKTGERYKVKAANRRAGRGLSGELILLDELREHQSFDSWGAITKTTIARPDAQVWALSNAGDATSVVLRYLRKKAHAAIGDPDGFAAEGLLPEELEGDDLHEDDEASTLGIFEWSARPGADTKDREAWAAANPALGHGFVTERTLAAAEDTDPEWIFRTECLCQWSDGSLEGPFPPGVWAAGADTEGRIRKKSDLVFGLDVSTYFSRSYIGVAGFRKDKIPQVEMVAAHDRTDWVVPWFRERAGTKEYPRMKVAVQGRGAPVSSLIEELEAIDGLEVLKWQGSELGNGTGAFYNAVCQPDGRGVKHRPSAPLDLAAATAVTKPSGDSWWWDRQKSATDIAPLVAVTAALWGLNQRVEPVLVSAYERSAVEVI